MYGNNAATYGGESESWGNFMQNGAQLTSAGVGAQDWTNLFGNNPVPETGG
jgi:hypothetical protein